MTWKTKKIELKGRNGVARIHIGLSDDDSPQIRLFDADAKQRLSLEVDATGSSSVFIYDQKGCIAIMLNNRPLKSEEEDYNVSDIEIREDDRARVRMQLTSGISLASSRGCIGVYHRQGASHVAFGYQENAMHCGCGGSILGTDSGPGITVEADSVSNDIKIFGNTNTSYLSCNNDTNELNVSNALSEANQTPENQESEKGKKQKPGDRPRV